MTDLDTALQRAQSRAAVLSSLESAYGPSSNVIGKNNKRISGPQTGIGMKKAPNTGTGTSIAPPSESNSSDKGVVNDTVETILHAVGDKSIRSKQFFKDSLRGKAIVVENLKAQLDASKASKRIELAGKRKVGISRSALKRRRVADPSQLPSTQEISYLHDMWWEYAQQIVGSCSTEAQLQARAHSMELVGARVYVLDAEKKCLVGKVGIVTATSKHCLYLAVDCPQTPHPPSDSANSSLHDGSKETKEGQLMKTTATATVAELTEGAPQQHCALRVVRDGAVVGLVLPSKASSFRSKTAATLFTETTTADDVGCSTAADAREEQSRCQWDQRERADPAASMCVLYGKHFLPHCTYS